MFKTIEEAILQGLKDYQELPAAYASLEAAIKYRTAEFICSKIRDTDTTDNILILDTLRKALE